MGEALEITDALSQKVLPSNNIECAIFCVVMMTLESQSQSLTLLYLCVPVRIYVSMVSNHGIT